VSGKFRSPADLIWTIAILWFLWAHLFMYEQYWGEWSPFYGFTLRLLGTWHMPQLPGYARAVEGGPIYWTPNPGMRPFGPFAGDLGP
jgi:hypothetical protein